MSYNNNPKGSEWYKWDLHIHTPESIVNHFTGANQEEKWENFILDLEALPPDYKVIGINDYLFIDGYRKVLEYKDGGRLKNIETILPVVEFRIKKFAGHTGFKRINFHVIFSDKLSADTIQNQFLNTLQAKYSLTPGMPGIQWSGTITKESLIDLGGKIKKSVPAEQLHKYGDDLEEGFNNLNLDESDILELLRTNTFLKGKSLTAIGKTEWESLSWNDNSIAEKKDVINKADFVFISSDSIVNFNNAKNKLKEQAVNDLLLDCSDAHYNSSNTVTKDRIGKCFTWIKGYPTFEGLRQVIYEPNDRVSIQQEKPQQKTNYLIIDKVRFKINNQNVLFPNEFIEINPNMNAIIGGKSSGKSLLLYHIAKTIDPPQVEEKMKIVEANGYGFDKDFSDFDFEVHWKDGYVNSFRESLDRKVRQITYIPQMYINHLAEEKGEDKLKELIETILNQNESYKLFVDTERKKIQEKNLEISNGITKLYGLRENLKIIQSEIKAIGDKAAIQTNIEKIKKEIDDLRKRAGFSEEENKKYENLKHKQEFNGKVIERYLLFDKNINDYIGYLESIKEGTISSIRETVTEISSDFREDIVASIFINKESEKDQNEISAKIDELKKKYIQIDTRIKKKVEKHKKILEKIDDDLKPFLTKITNQNLLNLLNESLLKDLSKIKQIEEKEKIQRDTIENGTRVKESLFENYTQVFDFYKVILARLRQPDLSKIHDLELITTLSYDVGSFTNGFSSMLDGRSNFQAIFGNAFNEKNEFQFNEREHLNNVQILFDKISVPDKNGIKFRSGFESKDAGYKLFEDYFTFKYTIKQNNDDILQMSPGKRGLVLLQLILHLSNAIHPILIDQPEDNLDNRTIFNDLNQFIKDKKIQRQILIVTHNANLVVSTDSEQIIVANQQGQDKGKDNEKFTFEYVTGALEYSFKDTNQKGILFQMGIREHVCDILEGGEEAFHNRERKYGFAKH